jgi:hypothetical protein
MVYNLNRIKKLIGEFHPELGDIGFYTERPYDVVETFGLTDIQLTHPKRVGVNVLGRPDLTVNDIERFQDTMRYMGFDPYYWDYDNWGMLYFEFSMDDSDELVYV